MRRSEAAAAGPVIQPYVRRLRLWWLGFSLLVFLNILSSFGRFLPNHATLKSMLLVHSGYLHHDIRQYLLFALLVLLSYYRHPSTWGLASGIIGWRLLQLWWSILDYRSWYGSNNFYPEFARLFYHIGWHKTASVFFSGSNIISVLAFSLLYGYWLFQCLQVVYQLRKAKYVRADGALAP